MLSFYDHRMGFVNTLNILVSYNTDSMRVFMKKSDNSALDGYPQKGHVMEIDPDIFDDDILNEDFYKEGGNFIERAILSEEAMATIHETLKSGSWSMEYNEEGVRTSVYWSDAFRKMLGYESEEDFPNTIESWSNLLFHEDKERVLKALEDTAADYTGQTTYDVEYRMYTKNEGKKWFRAAGRLIRREDGSPITFVGLFQDINDEKLKSEQIERILKKQAEDNGVIKGLSSEYSTVWLITVADMSIHLYSCNYDRAPKAQVEMGLKCSKYNVFVHKYINTYVSEAERDKVRYATEYYMVLQRIPPEGMYSVNYKMVNENGTESYHQMTFTWAMSSEGQNNFVLAFRNVDDMMREEQERQKVLVRIAQSLREQLAIVESISEDYTDILLVDYGTNKSTMLKANGKLLNYDAVIRGDGNPYRETWEKYAERCIPEEDRKNVLEAVTPENVLKELEKKKSYTITIKALKNKKLSTYQVKFLKADSDDSLKNLVVVAFRNIDDIIEMQRHVSQLEEWANRDQLTGFLNRRAYEKQLEEYSVKAPGRDFIFVSMDINGLKIINDTLGHSAGDELLKGAAQCMEQCFGKYGQLYRTGGDEFVAMIFASLTTLEYIKEDFARTTAEFKGTYIQGISVSCGYLPKKKHKEAGISELAELADKKMYSEKDDYYLNKGIVRRNSKISD